MRWLVVAALIAAGGCKKKNPDFCSSSEECTTGALPFCDVTGEFGGTANQCIPIPFDAGGIPGADAGVDGGGAIDAPEATALLAPAYGAFTGSVFADAALRPTFRWTDTARAARYELQVDDSCDVVEFPTCEFPSPELEVTDATGTELRPDTALPVSLKAPVGRRYYWRVRACNSGGCGDYSEVRYLNVGRQATDYNGDGYGDRLVGMNSRVPGTVGRAYLYLGGPSPIPASLGVSDVTFADPQNEPDGQFGALVLSVGDANADGFADLLIGAPMHDRLEPDAGVGYLYLGRATWPGTVAAADSALVNPEANGAMGSEIRDSYSRAGCGGGDVNGDGFSDFSLATFPDLSPTEPTIQHIHFGRPSWPSVIINFDVELPDHTGDAETGFAFTSDCSGDVDGDGLADVILGAGRAYVYLGRRSFGSSPATLAAPDATLRDPIDKSGLFGLSVSNAGDINGDGLADVAIGAPVRSAPELGEGGMYVFFGAVDFAVQATSPSITFDNPIDTLLGAFGQWVDTTGDVNGDGIQDLVVGHPFRDGPGDVFVFFGRSDWPTDVIVAGARLLSPFSDEGAALGARVSSSGDYNGDGTDDIAGSSPQASNPESGEGSVVFWLGRDTWPASVASPDGVFDNPTDTPEDNFGGTMK